MRNEEFIREPIQVVEIVQPLCSRTFGVSPCNAQGANCYNTDRTCGFIEALDLTDEIRMRFVAPAANRSLQREFEQSGPLMTETLDPLLTEDDEEILVEGISIAPPPFDPSMAIPALIAVDTAPTVLNVAAGNEDISPLGLRAVAQVAIKDFPFNDVGFDPYLEDRDFDPLERGSFWTKWLARNPYHVGYIMNIYDGYFGDALEDMIKREYSIEKIDASRSSVAITAKDILRLVTDNDVIAPRLSPGALAADIANSVTQLDVAGAVLDDYPAAGRIRINAEVIRYTGRSIVGSNIRFTGLVRGNLNTDASEHRQFDRVQAVLPYVDVPFTDIIYDLLVTFGEIPAQYITKSDWDEEFAVYRELFRFTAYISDPVPVQQLVGELCRDALSYIWWDERIQKIRLQAQRPIPSPTPLTDADNFISDSVSIREVPKDRASQVYVYFGLRNPTLNVNDKFSYAQAEAFIDAEAERQYGESKVKQIFSRWITTGVIARSLGSSYLLRFRDVRKHITFDLSAKDISDFWTGDTANIRHFLDVTETGLPRFGNWLITSAETVQQGGFYRFEAEDNEAGGISWVWVDEDETRPTTEVGAWVDVAGTDGAGNTLPFGWL